jgi:hypothetical protein
MQIHDWDFSKYYLFHTLHLDWVVHLAQRLNHGVLPKSYFALNETLNLVPPLGFTELPEPDGQIRRSRADEGFQYADDFPPHTRFTFRVEQIEYATRCITVRDDNHAPVAAILWVSAQEKQLGHRWRALMQHIVAALAHELHLLVIDLFPPGRWDPNGIHGAIWDQFRNQSFALPPDLNRTIVSYDAGQEKAAYVEPVAAGMHMPDMPLFIRPGMYVNVPLAESYEAAWSSTPDVIRRAIEAGDLSTNAEDE